MADIQADNLQQDTPDERKSARKTLLGSYFNRDTRHHERKTLQAATMARQGSRKRTGANDVLSRSRRRPATYASATAPGGGRQKIMVALIPVLAVTFLYLLRNPVTASTPSQTQEEQSAEVVPAAVSDVEFAWEIPPLYQPGDRDPMRLPVSPVLNAGTPRVAPVQPRADFAVTGILHSEDRPVAIVDTVFVHEGEQISGATVVKIEKDTVHFEMNGKTWSRTVQAIEK